MLEFLQRLGENECCACVCVCVCVCVKCDDSIVIEDLCEDGGRLVQMLMRADILFGGVAVVAVG